MIKHIITFQFIVDFYRNITCIAGAAVSPGSFMVACLGCLDVTTGAVLAHVRYFATLWHSGFIYLIVLWAGTLHLAISQSALAGMAGLRTA